MCPVESAFKPYSSVSRYKIDRGHNTCFSDQLILYKPAQYASKIRHPLHQIKLNGVSCLAKFSNYHPSLTASKSSLPTNHRRRHSHILVCCYGWRLWELMEFQRLIFQNRTKMRNKQLCVFRNQKCNHACWRLYKRFHRHRTQRKMGTFHW